MIGPWHVVEQRLAAREPLSVVFVNDTGFIGGAGVAHGRQMQAFLDAGHDVAAICWLDNSLDTPLAPRGRTFPGRWKGLHSFPELHTDHGVPVGEIVERLLGHIRSFSPDLVVVGNLHWAGWPVDLVEAVADAGIPVVAYVHDCHWLTGRCVYMDGCTRFLTGCDHNCPTPDQYPVAAPQQIRALWQARRRVFSDKNVPLIANSQWTFDIAQAAFAGKARVRLVPLGLDTSLFSPVDKALARRLLHLPQDAVIVLAGAVDLKEKRKGGRFLMGAFKHMVAQDRVLVLTFGWRSNEFENVTSLGHISDERLMPIVYSASDLLVHAATEETFGQTLMEAAACAIPSLAFHSAGMTDIARHDENAITVATGDQTAYFAAFDRLVSDKALRDRLGRRGREIARAEYGLDRQYERWRTTLMELAGNMTGELA